MFQDYFGCNLVCPEHLFYTKIQVPCGLLVEICETRKRERSTSFNIVKSTGTCGFNAFQNHTAAPRVIAYGVAGDAVGKCLGMGETMVLECMKQFTVRIIECF